MLLEEEKKSILEEAQGYETDLRSYFELAEEILEFSSLRAEGSRKSGSPSSRFLISILLLANFSAHMDCTFSINSFYWGKYFHLKTNVKETFYFRKYC